MSKLAFTSRKGVLTVKDMRLVSGADVALVRGGFTYQMDTSQVEHLVVDALQDPVADAEDISTDVALGFLGEVQIGMPWNLLGQEPDYRDKHFTKDDEDIGWLTVPIKGTADEITADQSKVMDHEWADLLKQAGDPFERKDRHRTQDN